MSAAIGSAEQLRLPPKGDPAQAAFGRIVRETQPAVTEKADEAVPARQHVVHRLGHGGMAGEPGALRPHPVLQSGSVLLAGRQPLGRRLAVQGALEIEEGVDARRGLQRQRRDRRGILAASRVRGDVGQLEEASTRMRPARICSPGWLCVHRQSGIPRIGGGRRSDVALWVRT